MELDLECLGEAPQWVWDLVVDAQSSVTAFQTFLSENGGTVALEERRWSDMPVMTKANYLARFEFADLVRRGLGSIEMISSSSGSSGEPSYWPRGADTEAQSTEYHRRILEDGFRLQEHRTLVIIAFSMGMWIAGGYTLEGVRSLARRSANLAVISPGIGIEDNVQILRELAPKFERVVLAGYPPLAYDILSAASEAGVDLPALSINLMVAGENISEAWRDRVTRMTGGDPVSSIVSIYGTADAGMIGHETPATIRLRREVANDARLATALFPGITHVPTFVGVDPSTCFMEELDGAITFTVSGVLPLIRYRIGDLGRVMTRNAVRAIITDVRPDILHLVDELPEQLVGLYGRADVATTFYAVNIYPENIKHGLDHAPHDRLTGKFILDSRDTDDGQVLRLTVEVETTEDAEDGLLAEAVGRAVSGSLVARNGEYRRLREEIGYRANPEISLVPRGSEQFEYEIKHRWIVDQ